MKATDVPATDPGGAAPTCPARRSPLSFCGSHSVKVYQTCQVWQYLTHLSRGTKIRLLRWRGISAVYRKWTKALIEIRIFFTSRGKDPWIAISLFR